MPIVVLGCGKGGTSLVSELLARMGVHMGVELPAVSHRRWRRHDPAFLNFEDLNFRNLNHRILKDTGREWYDAPEMDELLELEPRYRSRISALVTRKALRPEPWGWKCGLNAVMIPLYYAHLNHLKLLVIRRLDEKKHLESWIDFRFGHLPEAERKIQAENTRRGRWMIYDRIDQFLERYEIPREQVLEITFEDLTKKHESIFVVHNIGKFLEIAPLKVMKARKIIEYDEP